VSAAYSIVRTGANGLTRREHRVMRGADPVPAARSTRWTCPRCSGRGKIWLPGLGRGGMNVGGLYLIECPSCKGGRTNNKENHENRNP